MNSAGRISTLHCDIRLPFLPWLCCSLQPREKTCLTRRSKPCQITDLPRRISAACPPSSYVMFTSQNSQHQLPVGSKAVCKPQQFSTLLREQVQYRSILKVACTNSAFVANVWAQEPQIKTTHDHNLPQEKSTDGSGTWHLCDQVLCDEHLYPLGGGRGEGHLALFRIQPIWTMANTHSRSGRLYPLVLAQNPEIVTASDMPCATVRLGPFFPLSFFCHIFWRIASGRPQFDGSGATHP